MRRSVPSAAVVTTSGWLVASPAVNAMRGGDVVAEAGTAAAMPATKRTRTSFIEPSLVPSAHALLTCGSRHLATTAPSARTGRRPRCRARLRPGGPGTTAAGARGSRVLPADDAVLGLGVLQVVERAALVQLVEPLERLGHVLVRSSAHPVE